MTIRISSKFINVTNLKVKRMQSSAQLKSNLTGQT